MGRPRRVKIEGFPGERAISSGRRAGASIAHAGCRLSHRPRGLGLAPRLVRRVMALRRRHPNMRVQTRLRLSLLCAAFPAFSADKVVVGLITKTEVNPFFVKMKEGAQKAAKKNGATLMTGAGKFDGDNATQVTAIENMISGGAKAILITPSDTKAIVPAVKKARSAGVLVIALDTPTEPQDATDALFATDNFKAGHLAATSQQYPLKMAAMGVEAGVEYAKTGKKASGYTDTGVTLITDKPMSGVESKDTKFGTENCWGK